MSINCRDIETKIGCRLDAGGQSLGPVVIHYEYGLAASGETIVRSTRYSDAAGLPTTLAPGETVVPGECAACGTHIAEVCDVADASITYGYTVRVDGAPIVAPGPGPFPGTTFGLTLATTFVNDAIGKFVVVYGTGFEETGFNTFHDFTNEASGRYEGMFVYMMRSGNVFTRVFEFVWDRELQRFSGVLINPPGVINYEVKAGAALRLYDCKNQPVGLPFNADGTPYVPVGVPRVGCPDVYKDHLYEGDDYRYVPTPTVTVVPGALEVTGTAVTTPPVTPVRSLTVTRESGLVEFSTDAGATWVRMNVNGSRTWSSVNSDVMLDVSNMQFRGVAPTSNYDLIWEV